MIIDFTSEHSQREILQEEVQIQIASEPWWFSEFWRRTFCAYIISWNVAYVTIALYAYKNFQGYCCRPQPTMFDKYILAYEKFDIFKDTYFVFFVNHSFWIVSGLLHTILGPFVMTLSDPGSEDFYTHLWAFYALGPDWEYYET